ncbi:hypothetical protein [Chryseobacterium sp. SIMBA_038]|uniref:hypothetical protein n=1 Tax=Chryseobacterium sp. SIMBA_038 TaxID=3085780 RepID=UPI003979E0DF
MFKNSTKLCVAIGVMNSFIAFAQTGNVGINTTTPGSTIDINGSVAAKYSAVSTTPYTLTSTDFHVSYNGSSNAVFNLPPAINGVGNFKGRMYTIKNNTNFAITVNAAAPETINGSTNVSIPANQSLQLINTGLNGANSTWETISSGSTLTASNGLAITGNDVKLGGTLSQDTDIVTAGNNLSITGTGKVLVGNNTTPTGAANAKMVIDNGTTNGAIQIKDGTESLGYVLTSDSNGLATWSSTVTTAFANNWTSYSGTLTNPFTAATGINGVATGISLTIPAKGWYFIRSGVAINSGCNDYFFYINGIGDVWRSYCGSNTAAFMFPRDQNRVLYFATPGNYPVLAGKTNGVIPAGFDVGNPTFYLDFVKFQN